MAGKITKVESVLLGFLGIIALLGAGAYYLLFFIITFWYLIGGILLLVLLIIITFDYINYQRNNREIQELNTKAERIRNNVLIDYQKLISDKEILTIFDNAVNHFPKRAFLDPAYLRIFEDKALSIEYDFPDSYKTIWRFDSVKYNLNKIGIDIFKQNELFIDTVPYEFLTRATNTKPTYDEWKSYELPTDYIMFIEMVVSRYEFSSLTSRYFCIWKLLKDRAGKYYSTIWETKYGNVFETSESSALRDFVKSYCNILFIDHMDSSNISMSAYYLLCNGINPGFLYFCEYHQELKKLIIEEFEIKKFHSFEKKLTGSNTINEELVKRYSISDTDFMNGYQFENFVAMLFNHFGYKTIVTPSSGDQGIDIIAEKDGERVGIQAKCYSSAVTNSAIQEVSAGIVHYGCTKGIVVTNNNFTKSANALADSNQIILWDRQKLSEIINEVFA
jgi:hypothetical protein